MSQTPVTDATPHNVGELAMLCRQLERELATAKADIALLEIDSVEAEVHRLIRERDESRKELFELRAWRKGQRGIEDFYRVKELCEKCEHERDAALAKLRAVEADAAAMRDTVRIVLASCHLSSVLRERLEQCISKDAGRELLAEVERLRAQLSGAEARDLAMQCQVESLRLKVAAAEGMALCLTVRNVSYGEKKSSNEDAALATWQEASK